MAKLLNTAFIAIGSNLSNPYQQVKLAIRTIGNNSNIKLIKTAKIYKSEPYGVKNQPDFINTVIKVETSFLAIELLDCLLDIEIKQGRERKTHWGPRIIDLDIILYNKLQITKGRLILPHPFAHEREFVIIPLNDIEHNLEIPNNGLVSELAMKFSNHNMQEIKE